MPKIRFVSPLEDLTVEATPGTTILEAAQAAGAHVGHSCGGVCGCSTCHVYVRAGLESLGEQEELELDRLDSAFDVKPTSRLGCQAVVDGADLEVVISPESLSAWMDENPDARKALEDQGRWPLPGTR